MEGLNIGAILLGFLALFDLAIAVLVALGFLIARRYRTARLVFASNFLFAAGVMVVAMLSFFQQEFRHDLDTVEILLTALSFLLLGVGQFVAALRGPWNYAAALACSVVSVLVLAEPMLGGDVMDMILPEMPHLGTSMRLAMSLFLAAASVVIALLLESAARSGLRTARGRLKWLMNNRIPRDAAMTPQQVEAKVIELIRREPFVPFIVEMTNGLALEIPHGRLAINGRGALFLGRDGGLVDFDFQCVRTIR